MSEQSPDYSSANLSNQIIRQTVEQRPEFLAMMDLISKISKDPSEGDIESRLALIKAMARELYKLVRSESDPASLDVFAKNARGRYEAEGADTIYDNSDATRSLVVKAGKAESIEELQKIHEIYAHEKLTIAAKDLFRNQRDIFFIKNGAFDLKFSLKKLTELFGESMIDSTDIDNLEKAVRSLTSTNTEIIDRKIAELEGDVVEKSDRGEKRDDLMDELHRLRQLKHEIPLVRDHIAARNLLSLINQRDTQGLASTALDMYCLQNPKNMFGEGARLVFNQMAEDSVNIDRAGRMTSCTIKRGMRVMQETADFSIELGESVVLGSDLALGPDGNIIGCKISIEKPTAFNIPAEVVEHIDAARSVIAPEPIAKEAGVMSSVGKAAKWAVSSFWGWGGNREDVVVTGAGAASGSSQSSGLEARSPVTPSRASNSSSSVSMSSSSGSSPSEDEDSISEVKRLRIDLPPLVNKPKAEKPVSVSRSPVNRGK